MILRIVETVGQKVRSSEESPYLLVQLPANHGVDGETGSQVMTGKTEK